MQSDSAASSVPWDTVRRLRTHLESEQRYAFVDALDKLGEKACEAEYPVVMPRPRKRGSPPDTKEGGCGGHDA